MHIEGGCHCGGIRYALDWPGEAKDLRARACGCTFCVKHGGVWTSHPAAQLSASIPDPASVSKYRFGTKSAEFHVCTRCGAVPFVTSEIDGRLYAVVNVNTFETIEPASVARAPASFEGEGTGDRLERRKRNWIASVRYN